MAPAPTLHFVILRLRLPASHLYRSGEASENRGRKRERERERESYRQERKKGNLRKSGWKAIFIRNGEGEIRGWQDHWH